MKTLTIKDELQSAVRKLKENLKSPVSMDTITLLFNVSMLRAIEQMGVRGDHRGDQIHVSMSCSWYFEFALGIDLSDYGYYNCRWLEERRDYDYAKAVTDYFFDGLMYEYSYVEDRFAFLAIELPDYYISRNDLPGWDDETIPALLKKAMKDSKEWCYVDKSKVKEIKEFIKNF